MQQQSPSPVLSQNISTIDLVLFLVVDVQILFEPFLSFLPFGIILLQVLAKVDEMDLDFEITLADVVLLGFEVLFVSALVMEYLPNYSFCTSKASCTSYILRRSSRSLVAGETVSNWTWADIFWICSLFLFILYATSQNKTEGLNSSSSPGPRCLH